MKKISLLFIYSLLFTFIVGCDDDDVLEDNKLLTERRVYFSGTNPSSVAETANQNLSGDGEVLASSNVINVTFERSGADASQAVTVGFSATAIFASTSDFQNEGDDAMATLTFSNENTIVIPAGAYTETLTIAVADDLLSAGDRSVTIEITSVPDNYQIGFPSAVDPRSQLVVTIQDDDCPIDLVGDYEGDWEVVSFCAAPGSFNDGFCVSSIVGDVVTLTADTSDPTGTTAILSGGPHAEDFVVLFQTCPQTVRIDATYLLTFNQNDFQATLGPADEPDVYGTGTYNPDNFVIRVVGVYGNVNGAGFDEFIMEYKKL